jgi:hypothetical protein
MPLNSPAEHIPGFEYRATQSSILQLACSPAIAGAQFLQKSPSSSSSPDQYREIGMAAGILKARPGGRITRCWRVLAVLIVSLAF